MGRSICDRRPIQVEDLQNADEFELGRELALRFGHRTILAVPLVREDRALGAILVRRNEVRPFQQTHISLLTSFADQAAIAIENVRLFEAEQQRTRELSESLEQQTATAEVLSVISSSPGELEPVFQAMLENATRICNAKFGVLLLAEGETYRHAALYGASPAFAEAQMRNAVIHINPDTTLGRVARTKKPVQVADIRAEPAYTRDPERRGLLELAGARTILNVPMLKNDVIVGQIAIYRQEVLPFTDKQIELLKNFAAQAVIAIENTRLLNELRESLEQQTATADVLRVISSSPGELEPVFQAMLTNAVRICGAKCGMLYRYDGRHFSLPAHIGVGPKLLGLMLGRPIDPHPDTVLGRVRATNDVVAIADAMQDRAYLERNPVFVAGVEEDGTRGLLGVPMLRENTLVGAFVVFRQEVGPFTEKQIKLVQNFAAQAVIAIENTRLLNELRQRTDELGRSVGELRALGEVSQAVNSTLDLETVLSTIVAKAVDLSGTEAGAIYAYDEAAREFHLRATYGMNDELISALSRQHIGLDDPIIALTLGKREPSQLPDLKEATSSAVNDVILRAGYRALLVAPLLRGEDIVGMLVVRRKMPGHFAQNTVDLIKTFAAQSALAIQNARLFDSAEAHTRELAKSLEELRTAQDRLVQTQKLASLGQLTAGIAHEIKNPLNFVNNFSGLSVELLDELEEAVGSGTFDDERRSEIAELTETLRGNLDKIAQHGKRADAIVKNMLLHSRQGSGEHRPVDVNALVEESLNLAYHGARAEKQGFNITLDRSFDPAAGEADLFPQDITRVLLNLISNGFYAATKRKAETNGGDYEPTVTAATKNLGDRVEIRIRDNGTGIPPEVKEKLFSPFFTTKPAGEGTGLGLSISHDIIVKQHGGTIEVDTQPGEFTEFRIVLPRAGASLIKSGEHA